MGTLTHAVPRHPLTRRKVGWARARRYVLPLVGLAVALAFLGPYIVMVLNSLRPSSDVVQTPPTFMPRTWQWSTFGDVLQGLPLERTQAGGPIPAGTGPTQREIIG